MHEPPYPGYHGNAMNSEPTTYYREKAPVPRGLEHYQYEAPVVRAKDSLGKVIARITVKASVLILFGATTAMYLLRVTA
jgi:hypothetical protein